MNEVETRIVEMIFDNEEFEKGVEKTMSTVEKLKKVLNFTESKDSIESVTEAADGMNFNAIIASVTSASSHFTVWETVAMSAINNVVNKAMNAGESIAKAFTLDSVTSGFSEYETQMEAVQTILANTKSKGTTIDDVNAALDELNTYADKTIYNFTQMTKNIGTFTAAGLDLDTSVKSIQGIANLAAVSGSSSTQASTAMYQLSQALASGTVKLQDWNSVVNASMGGQVFQDALIATSKAMQKRAKEYRSMSKSQKEALGLDEDEAEALEKYDYDVDKIIEDSGTFRDSLTKGGWLTVDVLSETLEKMTVSGANEYLAELTGISENDVTNMQALAASSDDVDGEFRKMAKTLAESGKITEDEAYDILSLAQTAEDAATQVKTFTQLMDTLKEASGSGWTQTWEYIIGDFEEAKKLWTGVSDVLSDSLNRTAALRNDTLLSWNELGGRDDLFDLETGALFNFMNTALDVSTVVSEAFHEIFPSKTAEELKTMTENIQKFSEKFKMSDEVAENFSRTLAGVFSIAKIAMEFFGGMFRAFFKYSDKAGSVFNEILKFTGALGEKLEDLAFELEENDFFFNTFYSVIHGVIGAIKSFVKFLETTFDIDIKVPSFDNVKAVWEEFSTYIETEYEQVKSVLDMIGLGFEVCAGFIAEAFLAAGDFLGIDISKPNLENIVGFCEKINEVASPAIDWLKQLGDQVASFIQGGDVKDVPSKTLNAIVQGLTAIFNAIKDIVTPIGDACVSIINTVRDVINAVVDAFGDAALGNLNSVIEGGLILAIFNEVDKIAGKIQEIKNGVDIFATANDALDKFSGVAEKLEGVLVAYQTNINADSLKSIAFGLIEVAAAFYIVSIIDSDKLAAAVAAISAAMAELVTATGVMTVIAGKFNILNSLKTAISSYVFTSITVAVLELAAAMYIISLIPEDKLLNAEIVILTLITALVAVSYALSSMNGRQMMKGVGTLKTVAVALLMVVASVAILATLDTDKMLLATEAVVVLIAEMTGVSLALSNFSGKRLNKGVKGLLTISTSMLILAASVRIIGELEPTQILIATEAIVGLMGAMTLVSLVLSAYSGKRLKRGVNGMITMAASMLILAAALRIIGELDGTQVLIATESIIMLLASMTIVSIMISNFGGKRMTKGSTQLLAMAGSLLILSIAVYTLGQMDVPTLVKGVAAVSALILALGGFAVLTKGNSKLMQAGISMLIIAGAIMVISAAITSLGKLPLRELNQGFITVLTLMLAMGVLALAMDNTKGLLKASVSMVILSGAIVTLSNCVIALSAIDTKSMMVGVGSIAVLIAALTIASRFMKGSLLSAVSLVIMANAISTVATALAFFSTIGEDKMVVSIIALTAILVELCLAMELCKHNITGAASMLIISSAILGICKGLSQLASLGVDSMLISIEALAVMLLELCIAMKLCKHNFTGAASVAIMAVALLMLVPVLELLGGMSWDSITKMSAALAAVFTVLAFGGLILEPVIATLIALSVSIVIFAAALVVVGLSFDIIGTGMNNLAIGLEAMINVVKVLFDDLGSGMDTIQTVVNGVIEGLINLIDNSIPAVVKVIEDFITNLVDMVINLLTTVVGPAISKIVELVMGFLNSAIQTLTTLVSTLVPTIVNFIGTLITTVINSLTLWVQPIILSITNFLVACINGLAVAIPMLTQALMNLLISIINGVADTLEGSTDALADAICRLIKSAINAAVKIVLAMVKAFASAGKQLIDGGFFSGIQAVLPRIVSIVRSGVQKGVQAVRNFISNFRSVGGNLIQGFINGIKAKISDVKSAISSVATSAVDKLKSFLGIASPSKVAAEIGAYFGEGFVNGIDSYNDAVAESSANLGLAAAESMSSVVDGIESYFNNDPTLTPNIIPTLDFSRSQSGLNQLSSLFNNGNFNGNVVATADTQTQQYYRTLVSLGEQMLSAIQNGKTITIDGNTVIGYVNRGLGMA